VKVSSYYRPWRALRENRGIALLFCVNLGTFDGRGWSTSRPGRLYPRKDPVPIVQEAGWASKPVSIDAENIFPTGIRSPDLPASSELLYRLRHPGCYIYKVVQIWPRRFVCKQVTVCPGHIWTTLYNTPTRIIYIYIYIYIYIRIYKYTYMYVKQVQGPLWK
jgi:hypothetical protein